MRDLLATLKELGLRDVPAPLRSFFSVLELDVKARSSEEGFGPLLTGKGVIGKGDNAVGLELSGEFEKGPEGKTLTIAGQIGEYTPIRLGALLEELVSKVGGGLDLPGPLHDIVVADLDVELVVEEEQEDGERHYELQAHFTLQSGKGGWEVVPGLLELGAAHVSLRVRDGVYEVAIRDLVTVAGVDWVVDVELPYVQGRAEMAGKGHKIAGLLEHFHLHSAGLDKATLKNASIGFDAKARQTEIHVELAEPWTLGVLDIQDVQIDVDYVGGQSGGTSAKVSAKALIEREKGNPKKAVELYFSGEHPGPHQGWKFAGSVGVPEDKPITMLQVATALHLEDQIGPLADLHGFGLTHLGISYDTKTGHFQADCTLRLTEEATLQVAIERSKSEKASADVRFSGELAIRDLKFDLIFEKDGSGSCLVGVYRDEGGGRNLIKELVEVVSDDVDLPPLSMKVKSALVAYEKSSGLVEPPDPIDASKPAASKAKARVLFALDMDAGLDLSGLGHLPLVGGAFSHGEALKIAFTPVIATNVTADTPFEVEKIGKLLPPGAPQLPDKPITSPFNLQTSAQIGSKRISLDLNLPDRKNPKKLDKDLGKTAPEPKPQGEPEPPGEPEKALVVANPPSPPSDVTWIDVQKTLAKVVTLSRIGVGYQQKPAEIIVLLDGSVSIAGLTLNLFGLGVHYDLKTKQVTPSLSGLGLDFERGSIRIGADFVNFDGDFVGRAVLQMKTFGLSALGAFSKKDGHPSLFIYGVLNYPLGGPVFFFVEGLAAGFGFNRHLIPPAVQDVHTHPFVKEAIAGAEKDQAETGDVDPGPGAKDTVQNELVKLHTMIYPSVGEYFLAVGLKFNSFKLVDVFALLVVTIDTRRDRFLFMILGVATLEIPPESPEVLAFIELNVLIKIDPQKGEILAQAELTKSSWIFSKDCHLFGGYGAGLWFKGPHAGDFVYTVGGYHPHFHPPAHYPVVPRMGFLWKIGDSVEIKGQMYYALSPMALMAGGSLSATWHAGPLGAYFDVGVDFLIQFKPFHYEAGAHIEIGAHAGSLSAHLGADLEIWGPDFSGRARVSFLLVHFTVEFGAGDSAKPKPIPWSEFRKSFLPPKTDKLLGLTVTAGLIKTLKHKALDAEGTEVGEELTWWVVDPKVFALETTTVLPVTRAEAGTGDGEQVLFDVEKDEELRHFGVAPMQLENPEPSEFRLTVTRNHRAAEVDFAFEPIEKSFPGGVWGQGLQTEKSPRTVKAVGGVGIRPHVPVKPGTTSEIKRSALDYQIYPDHTKRKKASDGYEQMRFRTEADREKNRDEIVKALKSADVAKERSKLLAELGIDSARAVRVDGDLTAEFIISPRVGSLAA